MQTKSSNKSIILFCPENSGMAYMMAGYLHFYKSDMKIALSEENNYNHPIAIQVMQEDGINVEQLTSHLIQPKHLEEPIINIYIEHSEENINEHQFNNLLSPQFVYVRNPLKNTSFDEIVDAFRKTREEIKKISIEIAGSF